MEKEKLFLYYLFAALYRCGLRKIDISNETLKKLLPYLKYTLGEEGNQLEKIFEVDDEGVYTNYLKLIGEIDPLYAQRENNEVEFIMNDEMSNMFNNDNIDYIGQKVAAYIKIKQKEKVFYENN